MKGFNSTCKGESHIKSNKVCQDSSYCEVSPELSIALVSDGHGGEHYFRSDIGSKYACEVATSVIKEFVKQVPSDLFEGTGFTQFGIMNDISEIRSNHQIATLRRLSEAIIANWRAKIKEHAANNPALQVELEHVPADFQDALKDENRIAKVYGCTLMGYVQTPNYWFSFQVGDGKCFSFHKETGPKQPILWDDACFLNKTTSLCDSNAIGEFRFTYQGDGHFPYAVLLGSDGLDDSFGEDKNLINFYIQLLKMAFTTGLDKTKETVDADLPILSKRGSQDDMSVSVIWDESAGYAVHEMTEWQLSITNGELNQNKARIHKFHKERKSLECVKDSNTKALIDYEYAVKEISAAIEIRKKLIDRFNSLAREMDSENPKLFVDDIPYEKVIVNHTVHDSQVIEAGRETSEPEKSKDGQKIEVKPYNKKKSFLSHKRGLALKKKSIYRKHSNRKRKNRR